MTPLMKRKLFFCLFLVVVLVGCAGREVEDRNSIIIASWNVENLFDGVDDGTEYEEYLASGGWTDSQFRIRLRKVQAVFGYDCLKDASAVVLNEVENEHVVEEIMSMLKGFRYYACAGEPNGPIKTAVISKIPIADAKVHGISGQRPVLEVDLDSSIVLLALHGKSNLGDKDEDITLRRETGTVLQSICRKIRGEKPFDTIVIAGDFNEEISDGNIIQNPEDWTSNWDLGPFSAEGSYYYNDEWIRYDNILVSNNNSWKAVDGNVIFHGILESLEGEPDSWQRHLLSGVSDHLPVWIKIRR